MRKKVINPKVGAERVVRRFLWWPLRLQDEWRWLEWAAIRQMYKERAVQRSATIYSYKWRWWDLEFAD
jgi:hypothetical protein